MKQEPNSAAPRPSPVFNEKAGRFDRVVSGLGMGTAFALVLGALVPGDSNIQHAVLMTAYSMFGFAFGAGRESFKKNAPAPSMQAAFDRPGVIESVKNRFRPA